MKSSLISVAVASALLLAGASSALAEDKEVTVTTGEHSATFYKAERDKCKTLPGSDQARCMDSVGITTYNGEREGGVNDEMGSLQSRDRCDRLIPEDRRECLINDKAG